MEFLDSVVGVGIIGNEGAGVAADQVVEETKEKVPLLIGRGAGVREVSRVPWIRKRRIFE